MRAAGIKIIRGEAAVTDEGRHRTLAGSLVEDPRGIGWEHRAFYPRALNFLRLALTSGETVLTDAEHFANVVVGQTGSTVLAQ